MVQDAPLPAVELPVSLLARMARELKIGNLFKFECPQAESKLRAMIELGEEGIKPPFDREEGITRWATTKRPPMAR